MKSKANPLQKWPFLGNFFSTKKRLQIAKSKRNLLKRAFFINLGLFTALFGRKYKCQKLVKSKANPLQKWPKIGHFLGIFFRLKNVSKLLKMKGNGLKRRFLLI